MENVTELRNALERLYVAVPGQPCDKDWWPDELRRAMENAADVLYPEVTE